MSNRKLVLLVAYEIGDYDELFKEVSADHPEWSDSEVVSYLKNLENWQETFFQADWTIDALEPVDVVIKDV